MSPITLSNALSAARSINRAWIKWNEQDGPMVPFNGVMTKGMSSELHHTVMDSVDATADDLGEDGKREVEPEARRLMLILDEIGYSFIRWLQGISQGLSSARPTGNDQLENAFRRLHDALQTRNLPRPLSVEALFAMGAPPAQIAKKYGWKCEDGSADIQKVYEERDKPGTHYDPKTWVHPAEASINAEVEQQWAQRHPRPLLFVDDSKTAPKPQKRSVEDMIRALAPPAQIARVHGLTEQEVLEMAELLEVDLTAPREVKPVTEAGMHQEMIAQQERRAAAGSRARRQRNAQAAPTAATESAEPDGE